MSRSDRRHDPRGRLLEHDGPTYVVLAVIYIAVAALLIFSLTILGHDLGWTEITTRVLLTTALLTIPIAFVARPLQNAHNKRGQRSETGIGAAAIGGVAGYALLPDPVTYVYLAICLPIWLGFGLEYWFLQAQLWRDEKHTEDVGADG